MGKFNSIYSARVVDVKDPKKMGRVQVLCPEVTGDENSVWCTPCVPYASDSEGDFCLPTVDDFVWVMFEDGDPSYPVYLGGWWSEEGTILGEQYKNPDKVRVIGFGNMHITFSKSDNSIALNTYDDEMKKEMVIDVTPGKITMMINEDGAESTKIEATRKTVTVNMENSDTELTLDKDNVTLKVKDNVTIKGNNLVLDGNVTVKGNVTTTGGVSATGSISTSGSVSAAGVVSGSNI